MPINKLRFLQNLLALSAATLIITVWATVSFLAYQNSQLKKYSREYTTSTSATNSLSSKEDLSSWKTFTDLEIGYRFKYPSKWGVGARCGGDFKNNLHRFGEGLLKYPMSDCGTANIPSPVMFYVKKEYIPYTGYKPIEEKTMKFDSLDGKYYVYQLINRQVTGGPDKFVQVEINLPEKKGILIGEINNYDFKNPFDQILSTFKFLD